MSDEARFTLVVPEERAPYITGCRDTHVLAEDAEGHRVFVPRKWLTRTEPSTVTDEGPSPPSPGRLVERVAIAIGEATKTVGVFLHPKTERIAARAALQASGHTALLREIEELRAALKRIAKPGVGAASDWSAEECSDYWFAMVSEDRKIARAALSRPTP
jgi:hypothetical protein